MLDNDHPHVEQGPPGTWSVRYWRDGHAADRTTADRAVVEVYVPMMGNSTFESYRWPQQEHDVEKLLRAFARIYERGKTARSRELQELLKDV